MQPGTGSIREAGVTTRRAGSEDAEVMAELHRAALPAAFLSRLGGKVLVMIYASICEYPRGHAFVAESDGRILGFAAAVDNTRSFYVWFLERHFFKSLIYFLPHVFSLRTLRRAAETLMHPFRPEEEAGQKEKNVAELLSIAVYSANRRGGVGALLFERIRAELAVSGLSGVEVVVGSIYPQAEAFYRRMGFEPVKVFEMHKGFSSTLFHLELGNGQNGGKG